MPLWYVLLKNNFLIIVSLSQWKFYDIFKIIVTIFCFSLLHLCLNLFTKKRQIHYACCIIQVTVTVSIIMCIYTGHNLMMILFNQKFVRLWSETVASTRGFWPEFSREVHQLPENAPYSGQHMVNFLPQIKNKKDSSVLLILLFLDGDIFFIKNCICLKKNVFLYLKYTSFQLHHHWYCNIQKRSLKKCLYLTSMLAFEPP